MKNVLIPGFINVINLEWRDKNVLHGHVLSGMKIQKQLSLLNFRN